MNPTIPKTWWWLYAAAALSLFTTLTLPYIGEEAVYTITSLEMRLNHDFFVTTLYGQNYGRPPLLNWLVIPLAEALGWQHVLIASRLVAAMATLGTGLILAWLTLHLTRNRALAALSAAVFLSGDVLLYRGWLAYSDPLFTFFVFGAIACLWLSVLEKRGALLWLAMLCLTCGFLAKVQTAYLFYLISAAVLAVDRDTRRYLLGINSLAAHAAGLVLLLVWHYAFTHGAQSSGTATDVLLKLRSVDLRDYLNQLWEFPLETAARFLPASAIALYYWWRRRACERGKGFDPAFPWWTLIAMVFINYLPYWFGPKTHIRYVMPLYPLAALLIAAVIWHCGERPLAVAVRWLAAAVVLKYVVGLWLFPWYEEHYRGDYVGTAAKIVASVGRYPVYAMDVSATGLSVTAVLDALRYPDPYIHWPPAQWTDGFVLSYTPDPKRGEVAATYQLGGNKLYLLCRGAACLKSAPLAARQ